MKFGLRATLLFYVGLLVAIIIVNFGGLLITEKISDTQQGWVVHTYRVIANSNSPSRNTFLRRGSVVSTDSTFTESI
ncbi:MAG: hypothetical protein JKY27_01995 [Magnetovibrio sp.]|nr:hypothetical protein [Magnetovibrio sp.]